MQTILIIVQLLVSIALVIVVLLQKSEGGALGIGGGGGGATGGLFSPRGAGDALTRTTVILAVIFFLTSLGLTLLALHQRPQKSILDSAPASSSSSVNTPIIKKPVQKAPAKPAAPEVPGLPSPQQ